MPTQPPNETALLAENAELRARLEEAEETLRAIRSGEVDALVVESPTGPQVYSLQSADAESNRFRGDILTQINDVVIAIDLEQRITYFNPAAEGLYRIRADDVLGRKIEEVYTKHWPSTKAEAAVWSALDDRGEWQGEAIHRTFDGRELYVEANVSALRDHDGKAYGLLAVIRDITERKCNERLIEESQQRYIGIVESAMDAIITVDNHYNVLVFNPAAEKMFGCPADEAIGGLLERFIPEKFRHAHDLHLRAFGRITISSSRKMGSVGRVTGLRANGEEFPIEVSISQSGAEGAKVFTAILRDISERVRAEAILSDQLRLKVQLAKVAESAPGLVYSFRMCPDGALSMPYASPAIQSLLGFNADAVAEDISPAFTRIHRDDISHVYDSIIESARTLQPWRDTFRYDHPEKGEIWIEGHSMPQREDDESILWHGFIQDVTERKQVELELKERTTRYELVLDGAQDAIWDWDVCNKRIHFSSRWKALRGFAENEVSDAEEEWSANIHPEDKPNVFAAVQSHFEGKTPYFCEEYRIRCKDGSWKWIVDRGIAQKDASGVVIRMAGSENDITERKLAETALRERENELRLIMDATPALLSYLDTDFRYLRVNKTYENWFCLHHEQILGHAAREILGEKAWGIVSPYLERARSGERVSFDYKIPYGTGRPRWVHGNYIPDKDANGNVKGVVVHVTDIDDRKQAELERQKFVSLANNSQEFIGMCDMNFMPFYANAAGMRLVGLDSLEQALQTPVQEFFFPEDQDFIIKEFFPKVMREGRGEVEIRFRHFQTGAALWMIYNVFYITNDQGEPIGLATVSQNITARKQAELALVESERQNRFLADILEHADQPFGVGYPDGRLEYVNPAFGRLTGFSRDELLSMDWVAELTPPEWKAIELAKLEELQHNQQAIRYEKEYYRKDGTRVPIELLVEVVSDDSGLPLHYYAFITELTERKLAEAALRESEERTRLATETTGVGIWEWNVITNQIRWDAQMFRIYGVAPTQDGFVDYSTWSNAVLPEDLPHQEAILQDTAKRGGHSAREFRIQCANDKQIHYIQGVETVRKNSQGQIEWVVGTNFDITDLKYATQALEKSEARLALGVQVAGLAIAEVDYNSGLNYLSAQAARLFGLGDAEMVLPREAVHATFHPDDRAELLRLIDECLDPSGDGQFDMDHRVLWPDGRVRWLRVRKQVFFSDEGNGAGKPLRATLAIHDITTEKQAVEAVLASEAYIRAILNSLPEHVVVLDANGEITAVNEPWERFASENDGTPHAVSKGANYLDICRSSSAAGDRYAHQALIGLEDLFANRRQEFVMEYPCPTPSLNRWFLMQAKRTNQGIDGIILSHVDITERKRTEDELRNAQARLALVIEEVKAGYWDWDLKTNKLYLSPEWNRQLGLDEDDSLLQWDRKNDRLHPDDHPMVTVATENYIAGRQPNLELQFRLRHKDGSYRWIHSRGALLRDEDNQPIRLLGLNLDITDYIKDKELSKERDEMEKSFRLYVASQTAAAIAHELNQPLTAIAYYAYVIKDMLTSGNPNPQQLVKVIEKSGVQAQRAGDVIKQLTSLLHKGETDSEPLDINQSVNFACELVKSNGYHDKIKIKLNLADDLPLVTSNTLQIQKVLVNLINNALEAMNESGRQEGTVTVTTCRQPEAPTMAQVTVCDSGKGVTDSDVLSKMFQPFYTTKSKGLGMGLAISRALVVAHGGKMWAEPNADRGISVHFTLPFVS